MKNYDLDYIANDFILFLVLFVYLIGTLYLSGGNIFESDASYSAYRDNLKGASGLNEYLILLSCIFVVFKKNNVTRCLISLAISLYIFKSVIYGFRVQALMQFILLYFIIVNKDIKSRYLFIVLIFGFLLMLVYGFTKEGMQVENIGLELLVDTRYGYAQSHQQGVLSSSTAILNYQGNTPNIFINIPSVLTATVVPRGLVGDIVPWAYPSSFVQNYQYTPGGGLFTTQVYFLLGFPGLFIISFFMLFIFSVFLNFERCKPDPISALLFTVAVVFFPRWVSYDFFNYYARSAFILVCLYLLIRFFLKVSGKFNGR
ncbi:hypothetical protein F0259_14730 [Vibrio cyclitrophicus]|uniref:hypothetical protein n=1 Tax=Vibrio cyclitrophicus TaxID=47951 RepID=UPI00148CEDBE|nr:hypothetical protein [Vibrio cyclitrophicus]NOH45052.1 hypothetical protein [Vibrio cyclitrophicus]